MQISALGHSCVLLEFGHEGDPDHTRLLVDPWLSDHATGDAMGRFPRLRFEMAALAPVHGVYLSHAHCDHLDPYTLLRLWRELPSPPTLFIPITLSFLIPLFREHLDDPDIQVLAPHAPTMFRGVQLLGFYDVGDEPNNEEDVMVLALIHGPERVLVEADARLSLELPRFRAYISMLMCGPGVESAVFLTTENELTGTMEGRNCTTTEERAQLATYAMQEMQAAVAQLYVPVDPPDDLWQNPRLVRLVHGQGLTAPHELDPRWQQILFPVRIADRVAAERAAVQEAGCAHKVDALTVGAVHTIEGGQVRSRTPIAGLALLDDETQRHFAPNLPFFPDLPYAPLRTDARAIPDQRARVLDLLNGRLLPFLHGSRQPPMLHHLANYGGSYRIRVQYGSTIGDPCQDYVLGYGAWGFVADEPGDAPNEAYWANDLEDFLDGRCDEFSVFGRNQPPGLEMRLWQCLATPLLNSDLVYKRVDLHFGRARQGWTPGSYVMGLWGPGFSPGLPQTP